MLGSKGARHRGKPVRLLFHRFVPGVTVESLLTARCDPRVTFDFQALRCGMESSFRPLLMALRPVSRLIEMSVSCAHPRCWPPTRVASRQFELRELVSLGRFRILTMASAFVVEAPLGPALLHELSA